MNDNYNRIAATAQGTANNLGRAFSNQANRTAIDEILEGASQSGNEEDVDMAIGHILRRVSPEHQGKALAILEEKKGKIKQQKELQNKRKALESEGLSPDLAALDSTVINQILKNRGAVAEENAKAENNQKRYNQIVNPGNATKQPNANSNGPNNGRNPQNQPKNAISPPNNEQIPQELVDAGEKFSQFPEEQKEKSMSFLSDDQLIELTGVPGYSEPAKQELKRRQEERKIENDKKEGKIKRETELTGDILKKTNAIAETIPQKKSALDLMKNAIASKDLSFWSGDNLADLTRIEGFRSPEGAIFKTAGKEYFLGNIARAGSRPNQWVEMQILDMMPKIGRSTEANLSVARALENELMIDEERVRLTEQVSTELENKLGYVPAKQLSSQVNSQLKKYADARQTELYNDLRAIKGIGEKKIISFNKVTEGTPISKVVAKALLIKNKNDPKEAAKEAKKLGYAF